MPHYLALLRAVNVGGRNSITMTDLSLIFKSLGCSRIVTYIQSGNIIFDHPEGYNLAPEIKNKIKERVGLETEVIIRTKEEITDILDTEPFPGFTQANKDNLYITFLNTQILPVHLNNISMQNSGADRWSCTGRELYIHCPQGYGKTRLNNNFFEKKLKTKATTRSWKTIVILHEMMKD